jgi:hypothetical protein
LGCWRGRGRCPLLSDVAKVVLWSAIAEGERASILCVCADRWDALQVREEIFKDYSPDKDEEDLNIFAFSGTKVRLYFPKSFLGNLGTYSHILIFSDLISENSPGGMLHRLLRNAEEEGSGVVVVRC